MTGPTRSDGQGDDGGVVAAVWIDPGRKSGEPCVGGHRIPVEMVINTVWHHGVHEAMSQYVLPRAQVLGVCWYAGAGNVVQLHDDDGAYVAKRGPWRKRWGTWAADAHQGLWQDEPDIVPDPPTKADDVTPAAHRDHTDTREGRDER